MSLNRSSRGQDIQNLLLKYFNYFSGASEARALNKPIKQEFFLSLGNPIKLKIPLPSLPSLMKDKPSTENSAPAHYNPL